MAIDTSKLQVSNEQLLKGITSTALTALEYFTKLDAKEDQAEVKALVDPISSGFKMLNSQGYNAEIVSGMEESLELVNEASQNDDYDLYNDALATVYQQGTMGLEAIKQREQMFVDSENEIQAVYDEWSGLETRSMDALEVLESLKQSKLSVASKAYDANQSRLKNRLDKIVKDNQSIALVKAMDKDKNEAGIQLDMENFLSGYQEDALKELGFAELKDQDATGMKSYFLPEGYEMKSENISDAKEFYESGITALTEVSKSQLEVLALENPNLMQAVYVAAASGDRSQKTYDDAAALLGPSPMDKDQAANNIKAFVENIDRFSLHGELGDLYKKASIEIDSRSTEYEKVATGLLEADINSLSPVQLHALNYEVTGVRSGDFSSISDSDREAIKNRARLISQSPGAIDHLNEAIEGLRTDYDKIFTATSLANIETLATEDPQLFGLVNAYANNDEATIQSMLPNTTADMVEQAKVYAQTIMDDPELIKELDKVSDKMESEAANISAFQERWASVSGHAFNQEYLEDNRGTLSDWSNAWDDKLEDMFTEEDQSTAGLFKIKVPTTMKKYTPGASIRVANEVASNAYSLLSKAGGEMGWFRDDKETPYYKLFDDYQDAYHASNEDRMQSLKALSEYMTKSDGRGGYIPNITSKTISSYFDGDENHARLFLELLPAVRLLNNIDPALFKIR